MTGLASILILATLGGPPQVDSVSLQGAEQAGELVRLSATELTLKKGTEEIRAPVADILEIRLPGAAAQPARLTPPLATLADGSVFSWVSIAATPRDVTFETPRLGKLTFPLRQTAHLRFGAADPKIDEAWNELCGRDLKSDLLVIRKEDVLDYLDGTIGAIDDQTIHFVTDGEEVPVKREKVFGVIYAGRASAAEKAACEVTTAGSDVLRMRDLTWEGDRFRGRLAAGPEVSLPAELVRTLDFSLGKVRYLSQMEPREVKYTPFFDHVWTYHRDRQRDGGPLRLGNKTYSRGLWIHSRTLLRYRISGDYRRFQAVMGIDQAVAPRGDVHVVISGDGKPLLEADVRGTDPPQPVDLDVAGVRDLEIFVDFGGDLDIADHLDLAEAKVIK